MPKHQQYVREKSDSAAMGMTALSEPTERKTDRSVSCREFQLQSLNSIKEVFFHNIKDYFPVD